MKFLVVLLLSVFIVGCNPGKESIREALKDDPSILVDAIKANPGEIFAAIRDAAASAQKDEQQKKEEDEKKKLEATFENPLKPNIRPDEAILGPKNAAITLVEYSDFECPFCSRALNTVNELRAKYGKNLRFIYKHLPLNFHPNAMMAAQYFEGLRLQSVDKAFKYHDEILQNLQKVKQGEKYFKKVAKSLGADMGKLAKDVNSKEVKDRIAEDMKEAEKFGFRGTPGFLINGVPVKGAYPADHFVGIVEELKKRGKLSI